MVDLDLIKARLTPSDVLRRLSYDVPHDPRKKDATCPKHGGASLRLRDDQGYFYCHGGCADSGGKGDIVSLHMWLTGAEFKEAVKELADWAGVTAHLSPDDLRRIEQRRQAEDLLAWAASFYEALYPGSPAEAYAKARNLEASGAALGYAPDAWDTLLTAGLTAGYTTAQLEAAGLVVARGKGSGHFDQLRNRLIIPAFDRGRCVYLTGRLLGDDKASPKYLHTKLDEPPIYHLNGALSGKHIPVITESTTDTLRLTVAGQHAASTYGAKLQDNQRARLGRLERMFVAVHNDKAGAVFGDVMAREFGEAVRIAPPPDGYNDWDEALNAGEQWQVDENLTWLRWRLRQIPADTDPIKLKEVLEPLLAYLVNLDDAALSGVYLDEIRKHFSWTQDIRRGYERTIKERRAARVKASQEARRVTSDDAGQQINVKPDPIYINTSQAYQGGVVYVARKVVREVTTQDKFGNVTKHDVDRPVIITSDRRMIIPPEPKRDTPAGAVIYLNDERTLATTKPLTAASRNWSYASYSAHLAGEAPEIEPHTVYDQLLTSLKQYVYHNEPSDYVIDVLWLMGTYFHQQFDAYPYLAIHGHKGSGKTTLLHWLNHLGFNAMHVVNTSEASLFRMVEALAPTMLIDEQEGLNSRQAAKDGPMAAMMGILKSGYQRGATVTRQDPNEPTITQEFSVYSPKAIAAIESFEDILEDRSILVYMPKVTAATLSAAQIKPRNTMRQDEFTPLRDSLYLLLMQHSDSLHAIRQRVQNQHGARFGELVFPLLCLASLVDLSRGQGRNVLDALDSALTRQEQQRAERNDLTPEAMLAEAVKLVVVDAVPIIDRPKPEAHAQLLPDGRVVMDTLHLAEAFASLFPTRKESFFRDDWLGKQVQRTGYINRWDPPGYTAKTAYRWRRLVQERSERTGDFEQTPK